MKASLVVLFLRLLCIASAEVSAQTSPITVPELRIAIDGADNGAQIGAITSVVRLPTGNIVVADAANDVLHFVDPRAKALRSVGRKGSGPGEFGMLSRVGACSRDSVFAYDRGQNRMSIFDSRGKYVRQFTLTQNVISLACGNDGRIAATVVKRGSPKPGTSVYGSVLLMDATGKVRDSVENILIDEQKPLGVSIQLATGYGITAFGSGDSAFINIVDSNGQRRRIPGGIANRVPSHTHRDAAVEALASRIRGTPEDFARMRILVKRITPASVLPAYSGIFLDASSRIIWVQRSVVGDTATVLEARNANGSLLDTVYLPHHIQILGISDNLLLASVSDSAGDAESIEFYRINLRKR